MTKKSMQLIVAATLMTASFLTFSFTKPPKDITNGGGIANGVHFNYTAVENSNSTVGHFSWDCATYGINCVYVSGATATIYLDNGNAVIVMDGKAGKTADQISEPFTPDVVDCNATATAIEINMYDVSEGNLTVHK